MASSSASPNLNSSVDGFLKTFEIALAIISHVRSCIRQVHAFVYQGEVGNDVSEDRVLHCLPVAERSRPNLVAVDQAIFDVDPVNVLSPRRLHHRQGVSIPDLAWG